VLLFALANIGKHDVALYDGSWTDWGSRQGAPIAKGGA
jgi:thiosulfate/3-mercaptopyruvate sulfurtransferase